MQDSSEKAKRIRWLAEVIDKANTAYWAKNEQYIDDSTYDMYVEELKKLDPSNEVLQGMVSDPVGSRKIKHVEHMYSLDKVYEWPDLMIWAKSVARSPKEVFKISPKYDGLSIEVANGKMITRGNGDIGNDITHLAPWIVMRTGFRRSDPDLISTIINADWWKKNRQVGELLIDYKTFDALKNTFKEFEDYKTPRNLASGFANLKPDSELLKKLVLGGKPYPVAIWVKHTSKELECTLDQLEHAKSKLESELRNFRGCPTDGLVIRLADEQYAKTLGFTMHHPNGAMAFKFVAEMYTTYVKDLIWQVGNEAVTPVAVLDPVVIDGVTVTRATCHNAKFVADNNLAKGSKVTIVRRGGVIPQIVSVEKDNSVFIKCKLPTKCPICGSDTVYEPPDMLCINQLCPGRGTSKIVKGLNELGIEGIGPSIVDRIVRELHIPNIMAWCLETWDVDLLKAKGFTAHEIHVIISEIQRVVENGVSDEDILVSLCIPMVGRSLASNVIKYSGGIMNLIGKEPDEIRAFLDGVPRINSTAVNNLIDFFIEDQDKNEFEVYYNLFTHLKPSNESNLPKFCITGTLPEPRRDIERWISEHGGHPTSNIREANYLVSAELASTSSKMKYAREHNIPVITYEELKSKLSGQSR